MLLMLLCQVRDWSALGILHGPPHHSSSQHCNALRQNKLLFPLDQHPTVRDVDLRVLHGFIV